MTSEQQSDKFFTYLAIFKLTVFVNYIITFVAILLSIAFSRLELTTISIWGIFTLFMLDRYSSHLIICNQHKVTQWVIERTKTWN